MQQSQKLPLKQCWLTKKVKRLWWDVHRKLGLCCTCHHRKAAWEYIDGYPACDECVPRGCSCNAEPADGDWYNDDPDNWVEVTDKDGRKYPCCEWLPLQQHLPK